MSTDLSAPTGAREAVPIRTFASTAHGGWRAYRAALGLADASATSARQGDRLVSSAT
jgi:hypothetical protein